MLWRLATTAKLSCANTLGVSTVLYVPQARRAGQAARAVQRVPWCDAPVCHAKQVNPSVQCYL